MKFDKVLVGTNFETHCDTALKVAKEFAKIGDAKLELFHIVEDNPYLDLAISSAMTTVDVQKQIKDELETMIDNKLEGLGTDVIKKLYTKGTDDALEKMAADIDADLVIIGQKELSTFEKIFKSNFAYKVIAGTKKPTLIVKEDKTNVQTILVPLALSKSDDHVLAQATEWAKLNNAKICLAHVSNPPQFAMIPDAVAAQVNVFNEEVFAQIKESAKDYIDKKVSKLKKEGFTVEGNLLISDDTSDELLRFQAKKKADFIIMGTHAREGLDKLRFGSTALRMIEETKTNLLIINTED